MGSSVAGGGVGISGVMTTALPCSIIISLDLSCGEIGLVFLSEPKVLFVPSWRSVPMKIPAASTIEPPRTSWNTSWVNGILMYLERTKGLPKAEEDHHANDICGNSKGIVPRARDQQRVQLRMSVESGVSRQSPSARLISSLRL